MGCNRASNPPIDPSDPDACPPFLRELWWQDSTQDGTLVDDGDDSQAGYPFADQFAQKITPRTLRNFAYEVSRGLCSVQQFIAASDTCCEHIVFFLGDGVNGEDNYLYYSIDDPTPPLSPGMGDWLPLGDLSVDPGTFYPLTGDPTEPAHAPDGAGPGDWGITEDGWVWYIDDSGHWQQGPNIRGPQGQAGTGITPKGPTPEPPTGILLPPGSVGEGDPATNGDAVIVDGAADPDDEGHMWVFIDGVWYDYGELEGPEGPQGKPGATGPRGPTGPKGDPGTVKGLPPGGEEGQALIKSSDLDGEVVWADCCGGGDTGCGEHELTPADLEFEPLIVPALPWMGSGPIPGVPDAVWMSNYGMTAEGETATIPAPLAGGTNHIGQSFNLEWSPTAWEDGDYVYQGGGEGGGITHSFTFTADKPGSLDILFKGLYTDALSSGDIDIRIWPNDAAKITDSGWAHHIEYEPDAAGTEYQLSVSYSPNAPIRQHLKWDDPTLEMLFHDQSVNFSVTYVGLAAYGKTGEFYDQGVPTIDACYGTDLSRMMEETALRIPKPVRLSGTHNPGSRYGQTNQQTRGEGSEIHVSGPAGVRLGGDGSGRAFIDIPYTLSLSPASQEILVADGLVFDTTPVVSHTVTPQVSTLCSVSVALVGPTFDETLYLSADVKLMANNDLHEDPINIKECARRSIRLPLAGVWELPVTVSMGTSTELGVDPLWFDTKWFVRVVLTDPVVADKVAAGTMLKITPTFLVPSIGQYPYPSTADDE